VPAEWTFVLYAAPRRTAGVVSTHPNPPDAVLAVSVLDGAPGPVVVLDRTWSVRYVNRTGAILLDRGDPAALIGRHVFEVVPEVRHTAYQAHIETAMGGVPVRFDAMHAPTARRFDIVVNPVPDGVALFATDVTAQHLREQQLANAHARLDAIINSAPDMVLAVDSNLDFLAFNRAYAAEFLRVFGRAIRPGENFRDALRDHPVALNEAVTRWTRAAVHGEEFTVQRELGADGLPTRVYEIRYGSLRDASGTLIGAVSSMNDVTAHARDRSKLAELTQRLDAVIKYSPDRVVGVDSALTVVAMNDHARSDFSALWGTPIEVGDSLYERLAHLPTEQRTTAIRMWEEAVAGTAVSQFAVFGSTPETMQAYEISFGALRDVHGKPAGAVMVAKDVTDREVALTALRKSEARFRALGEAAPIGVFLADAAGHCTYANPRLQQIWELREAALLTTGFGTRVREEDHALVSAWLGTAGGTQDFRGEFRLVMGDGLERWVLAHSAAIRDDSGVVVGRVGTVDDITETRQAAEAQRQLEQKMLRAQKLESLEVLAGGIAHDFNNLLVGVLGNASLALLDLAVESPAYAPVLDIERAAQRASDLTRQMLAYSGRGQFVVEPVDLSELVSEMGSLLRTVLSRQARLTFDLDATLPLIEADATQIRQVVMNLITNASDAVGDDGGRIVLRTGRQEVTAGSIDAEVVGDSLAGGDYVFVEVQDTGVGMSEQTQSRVFEPFFTTKFTGRGLGLAATLGIVRGHRGGIRIHSAIGQGATFRVLLPATDAARPVAAAADPAVRGDGLGAVLVIDDDETVRVVARRLLERRGFRVAVAVDGLDGLAQFSEAPGDFALVLLDLTMPKLGGVETMAALQELAPDVRVLLTSGYREREVATRFAGMEPAGFVQKPFRAEELYSAVTRALNSR
jgi:two-component system, cell cycle sensor histidine kinase and response regulator CckA